MNSTLLYVIPISIFVLGALLLFVILSQRNKDDSSGGKKKRKTRAKSPSVLLKEANKRLSQNPKDGEALSIIAENYYTNGQFDKAYRSYSMLLDICVTDKSLDEFSITLKYALCAIKLDRKADAYNALMVCRGLKKDVFEVNFNLGVLEYKRKSYDKAAGLLLSARKSNPEHMECSKYLGLSLYELGKTKESVLLLRKAIDSDPTDKTTLFVLAEGYDKLGQVDQALKIFLHLRPDPDVGPKASLKAGIIHNTKNQHEKAVMDFGIGLKHKGITGDMKRELQYQLASTYINLQVIDKAIPLLKRVVREAPQYKDAKELLNKYEELNLNKNLQTYLIAPTSDFVTLCRRLSSTFFPGARIKITDISVRNKEYADILAEVNTRKWEDIVLFRYIRSTGQTGELVLRDLYAKTKDVRAGRAYCVSAGAFTEGAVRFVEARLIDLVDKKGLMVKLNSIDDSDVL